LEHFEQAATMRRLPHRVPVGSRREFLARAGGGFGALALSFLLSQERQRAATKRERAKPANPLLPKPPHYEASAKSVIFLFIDGGPSHIDLFDPKPDVNRLAGQPLPPGIQRAFTPMGVSDNPILASPRKWKQHGQSGLWISDWLPHLAAHADDLCVIRSCWADGLNHVGSVCQMNTGSILAGRPSLGAWVTYGLGTENQDLPAFVVLLDRPDEPPGGSRNWGSGFMPATYQGTRFRSGPAPILHLSPPADISDQRQRRKLDLLAEMNRRHAASRDSSELEARIASFELAFRMQSSAPEAVDLSQETAETKRLYGLDQKETADMARCCLLARRLVERGVRFVQVYCGSGSKWDAHANIEANHSGLCRASDRPIAGLLADLRRRGLLDQTLVLWGGEFGRTPMSEKGNGRDHNPYGFTMWLAGGGAQGGRAIGATDHVGLHAVEDRVHVHDLHATVLHLLGLDHEGLTFLHNGLDEKATTPVGGRVVERVFA
jgi:hypothetical protein